MHPHNLRKNHSKINTNHLLTKIIKHQVEQQEQKVSECLYGIFCAHLRAQGQCFFPHKRSHYHFLNLVPPINCINDEEEGKELSKAEKKQQKIIQKTINQQIDIGKLNKIEHQIKSGGQKLVKQEIWEQIDQKEKKVLEIVNSFDVSEVFIKLNEAKTEGLPVFDIKRKAMVQLRKKNEKLYLQTIDKEYRIANRLIKAFSKNKTLSLYELYLDINHDTLKSVREYFQSYFKQAEGIPQTKEDNEPQVVVHITTILQKLLLVKPQQYQSQFYALKLKDQSLIGQMRGNVKLFNMLVPFSLHKKQPFNKFWLMDSEQCTFTAFSNLLAKDYILTFHSKFKAAPEYSFGQIEQNEAKFMGWANKIHTKYAQGETEFKFVILLYNTRSIIQAQDLQEFQKEKLKQRLSLIKCVLSLFNPVLIFMGSEGTKVLSRKIAESLGVEVSAISKELVW